MNRAMIIHVHTADCTCGGAEGLPKRLLDAAKTLLYRRPVPPSETRWTTFLAAFAYAAVWQLYRRLGYLAIDKKFQKPEEQSPEILQASVQVCQHALLAASIQAR